jgi:hypothetical protein
MAKAEEAAFGMLVVPRTNWFVLAYPVIAKGGNVDQLRSLARSVTLECDVTIRAALSAPKEEEESEEEENVCSCKGLARIEKGIGYYE